MLSDYIVLSLPQNLCHHLLFMAQFLLTSLDFCQPKHGKYRNEQYGMNTNTWLGT